MFMVEKPWLGKALYRSLFSVTALPATVGSKKFGRRSNLDTRVDQAENQCHHFLPTVKCRMDQVNKIVGPPYVIRAGLWESRSSSKIGNIAALEGSIWTALILFLAKCHHKR